MRRNDIFHVDDFNSRHIMGHELPAGWWSRHYEYPYAIVAGQLFGDEESIVADMGCGYTYRPFKEMLADIHKKVYAIDINKKLEELPTWKKNIEKIIAPMDKVPLKDKSLDLIYCISVLEEMYDYGPALKEFNRLLKDDGRVILTFDIIHDAKKPEHERWKGTNLRIFRTRMQEAGFEFDSFEMPLLTSPESALVNLEYNLCVYHCILKKRLNG